MGKVEEDRPDCSFRHLQVRLEQASVHTIAVVVLDERIVVISMGALQWTASQNWSRRGIVEDEIGVTGRDLTPALSSNNTCHPP